LKERSSDNGTRCSDGSEGCTSGSIWQIIFAFSQKLLVKIFLQNDENFRENQMFYFSKVFLQKEYLPETCETKGLFL